MFYLHFKDDHSSLKKSGATIQYRVHYFRLYGQQSNTEDTILWASWATLKQSNTEGTLFGAS